MTSLDNRPIICGVCGAPQIIVVLKSSNTLGAPDLDTRPAEMMRSTIHYWVQRCPECGCCGPDLEECNEDIRNILESTEYIKILNNPKHPETATSFLASSHIYEQKEDYEEAAWEAINAAWICDDENDSDSAKYCREKALSINEKGKQSSQFLSEEKGASEAITIDLLRRTGNFQEALELIAEARKLESNELMQQIFDYEEVLIKAQDIACHTIDEATYEK